MATGMMAVFQLVSVLMNHPEVGSHFSHMANTSMRNGPMTNSGTDTPMMATAIEE